MKTFSSEREGQIEFYKTFLPLIDSEIEFEDIISDNNDGVINGNLLEFKLNITDLNAVLFQCIKYLSSLRIKGKPVPANIWIIDLCSEKAYLYKSENYLEEIEKVYNNAASKNNFGFSGKKHIEKLMYGEKQMDAAKLIRYLKEKEFTKIHIDENCIVGWANTFYDLKPDARKEDFIGDNTGKHKVIGEIRDPNILSAYIYPYTGKTNVTFQYLMDKLNDTLQKKNLGAFYTPMMYAEKSHELLRMAIERVPEKNDYVIIDRCAGTGNLEKTLTDEELSHSILSTIEYYEYKVLQEILGSKVRHIIPPIEADNTFNAGLVRGADALSKEYIDNPVIKQYIDNPNCTIILFENPPFAETTSAEHQRNKRSKTSSTWKNSYATNEMKKEVSGSVSNDLGNVFIWSAFKYYLRKPSDSYIVYSPVKYWKAQHLIDKEFIAGYAFNRRHFHTKIEACIMVALWSNKNETNSNEILLDAYNVEGEMLVFCGKLPIKKIYTKYSKVYYDKRKVEENKRIGILCGLNGLEKVGGKQRNKPATSEEILGYMVAHSSGFDNPDLDSSLLVGGRYDGNGFYLRKDNYLEKLPMFCASRYITYNRGWTERARIMKSADGSDRFLSDIKSEKLDQYLRKCLLFTCLEMQNHMRTFVGSDERMYRNELCLDTTNGETIASHDLKKLDRNEEENRLIEHWNDLMEYTKKTNEYDKTITYGIYQIYSEIDTSYKDEEGNVVWNNIEVHSQIQTLKTMVKEYYNREIVPILFEYEFLK